MLKIKDNVDLKKLEKFGFTDKWSDGTSLYRIHTRDWICYYIEISKETRILQVKTIAYFRSKVIIGELTLDIIFDLIQAGLVEKVIK